MKRNNVLLLATRDAVRRTSIALVVLAGLLGGLAAFGADPAYADGFLVTSTTSDIRSDCELQDPLVDACTLLDALFDANQNSNESTIGFDLKDVTPGQIQYVDPPGSGIDLYHTTTIDGFTQDVPGLPPGTPPISLGNTALVLTGDGSVIRGLMVGGPPLDAGTRPYGGTILITGSGARIQGNWIGVGRTQGTGTGASSSVTCSGCTDAVIGGPNSEDRNVLSGNAGYGVWLSNASDVTISGNYIGLAPDGTVAGNRLAGVQIEDDSNGVTVGGTTPVEGNVISGNGPANPSSFEQSFGNGVDIRDASNVLLQRNRIGTNPAGTTALPNTGHGVRVEDREESSTEEESSTDIDVGTPGHGNLISGNGSVLSGSGIGVLLERISFDPSQVDDDVLEVDVQGNRIGTTANGTGSIPNRLDGVRTSVGDSHITVGGSAPLAGNTIANSQTGFGVNVFGIAEWLEPDEAVEILGNSIHDNAKLGISLDGGANPLANDGAAPPYDTDIGPNDLQNYPVLDRASSNGVETTVSGELRTTSGTFRVELFSNPSCDPSGNGEGRTFLGAFELVSGGPGPMAFTRTLPNPIPKGHSAITATATNIVGTPGKTSEFSRCVAPTPGTNTPPEAADDLYATDQDDVLEVGAPGVLSNDTDSDGDPLTVATPRPQGGPPNGTLTLDPDGSFTYTPDPGFAGTDSFTYKANDGTTDSNVATVTIRVDAVDDPPEAEDDSYTTEDDETLDIAAPGVLENDTNPGGGPLTVAAPRPFSGPTNGTLTLNADGSFAYAPDAGFSGDDSFTYKASGGGADSNAATVTITVRDATPPPAPTIIGPADNSFDTDGAVALFGGAEAYSTVKIFEGAALRGTTTAIFSGAWFMTLDGVSDGPHTYRARATDEAGNTSGFSNARTVRVDTTKPAVTTVAPPANTRGVVPGVNVRATFSEAIDAATLRDAVTLRSTTFKLARVNTNGTTTPVLAKVTYVAASKTATLNPDANLLPGKTYTVTVTTGARDLAGNQLDQNPSTAGNQPKTWRFTVK